MNQKGSKSGWASIVLSAVVFLLSPSIDVAMSLPFLGDTWKFLWACRRLIFLVGTLIALLAIVLGFRARSQILHAQHKGRWLAMTGVVMGCLCLVPLFLFTEGQPHYEVYGEGYAVAALRTLNTAIQEYAGSHPRQKFPATIRQLGEVGSIDPVQASGVKYYYRFTYVPRSLRGDGRYDAYQLFADPLRVDRFSRYHFFTDETGIIRISLNASASARSTSLEEFKSPDD